MDNIGVATNHLERSLRAIPTGRRNWLFAWTELGAQRVGIIQSLLVTCRLQGVDPYTYLVDVLQRIGEHPAKRVIELTPRVWKTMFADHPLRSDLARTRAPPLQLPSRCPTPWIARLPTKRPERLDALLVVGALASLILWLLRLGGANRQGDRHLQTNTERCRSVLSTLFLGQELWRNHRFRITRAELFDARQHLKLLVVQEIQYA